MCESQIRIRRIHLLSKFFWVFSQIRGLYFRSKKCSRSCRKVVDIRCNTHHSGILIPPRARVASSVPFSPVSRFKPRDAWACQKRRLSSGVFDFRRLWVTWDGGQGGKASGGRRALTFHEHRVQTSNFGGEESVNAVKHSEEVGELQLL